MTAARVLVWLAALATLTACGYKRVDPGPYVIAEAYEVRPTMVWSRIQRANVDYWTVDGEMLETLHFTLGLPAEEPLFPAPAFSDEERPRFRADLSPNGIMDFVVDSLARQGAAQVRSTGLRPMQLGGEPGFRFELDFATGAGLEMRGTAAGAVRQQKLYLILFTGARLHYFERYAEEVERIIASVRWL